MTAYVNVEAALADLAHLLVDAGITGGHTPLVAMPAGQDNLLYATSAGGRQLVVKIPRGSRVRYGVAAWAAARLGDAGVPTPTVLVHTDRLCVETRCLGQPLTSPSHPRRRPTLTDRQLATAAGRLLRRLHTIRVTGFGRLDATGTGLRSSLRQWLTELRPMPAGADPDLYALRSQVQQVLRYHAATMRAPVPRLLHGDWTARHLIGDAGAVTGFVDLESVRGGDPLADLAGWSLQEPADLTDALFAGYFTAPPDPATCTTLAIYRLRIACALLASHVSYANDTLARMRSAQLRADLADLSAGCPAAIPRVRPARRPSERPRMR